MHSYPIMRSISKEKECSLTEAMRQYGIPRNTLRDYIGICELKIIDAERYTRVIEAEREKVGKVSVKCIELSCRAVLNECRVQANKLKQQKKAPSFLPERGLLLPKVNWKKFLDQLDENI